MLCRASGQTDVSLLLTFAALSAALDGQHHAGCGTVAACLRDAAVRYGVPQPIVRAAERAWTDRFGETGDSHGIADRHSLSQRRW